MNECLDKVSIIIPVYGVEKFIQQCLDSVIAQTHPHWEMIIINDCSPDNSDSIIIQYQEQYPHKIKYIYNTINQGQGISRNNGVEIADGKWIFFLDSDDYLEPNCLEILLNGADRENDDIILGGFYKLKSGKKIHQNLDIKADYLFSRYALAMYAWGTLFRRDFWCSHQFKFEHCYYAEDLLLISKVWSKTQNITVLNDSIYCYRINSNSATHRFHSYQDIHFVLKNLLEFSCKHNSSDELIGFAMSNSYNLIKIVASPIARYKLFLLLKSYIPKYPVDNHFMKPPLVNNSKAKKLKAIYSSKGLCFFWRIDSRIFKNLFRKS